MVLVTVVVGKEEVREERKAIDDQWRSETIMWWAQYDLPLPEYPPPVMVAIQYNPIVVRSHRSILISCWVHREQGVGRERSRRRTNKPPTAPLAPHPTFFPGGGYCKK